MLFLNQGAGQFAAGTVFDGGGSPSSLSIADVDADGDPDILVPNYDGGVSVLLNLRSAPTGIAAYGDGTANCGGTLGIGANTAPLVGDSSFAITCTNAPPSALGTLWFSPIQNTTGTDVLGIRLHVGPTVLIPLAMRSDAGGVGITSVPVPNTPRLRGVQAFAQAVWFIDPSTGSACTASPIGGMSSRGLSLTIQ